MVSEEVPRGVRKSEREHSCSVASMVVRHFLLTNNSCGETKWCYRWPQAADEFLEDMHLPSGRSGGWWFNWIFKVIDLKEIANLTEERNALRLAGRL